MRIQGGKPQNSTRLTVSLSLFQETFLTSTFGMTTYGTQLPYDRTTYEAEMFKTDGPVTEEERIQCSTISKCYITGNLRWKRAKKRNSSGVT